MCVCVCVCVISLHHHPQCWCFGTRWRPASRRSATDPSTTSSPGPPLTWSTAASTSARWTDEAHALLSEQPQGTFLVRDSTRPDVFFTLSYHSTQGPTSVRIELRDLRFGLAGSHKTFSCLFALLEYYRDSPKRSLRRPYRGAAPQGLQQLGRLAVVRAFGRDAVDRLPVSVVVRDYIHKFPFRI
uniref:Suppressor of cytokine signaling 1 n=1 Tax=Denticeps clupeoides TaxID=299321 RepID=A0AAY4CGS3_9TELE